MELQKIIISKDKKIREALQLLDTSAKKALFVVQDNKLIGAISDGDIRRWILKSGDLDDSVYKIMNTHPIVIKEHNKQIAIDMMKTTGVSAIPVVDDNDVIQMVYFWNEELGINRTAKITSKVIIMAGGKGERLLPYTSVVPKPLIPIDEKPILEHIINSFVNYGCEDFYLTINYKKNMIKAYFEELDRNYSISYIEEEKPLGTGGSLRHIKDKVRDTFYVSNCDILLDVDYSEIMKYHIKSQNSVTIIASLKHTVLPYGVINLDDNGTVSELIEKPGKDYLINTGVYILEPKALNYLGDDEFIHITQLIERCIADGNKVGIYPISEEAWMDMGQFDDLKNMKSKFKG